MTRDRFRRGARMAVVGLLVAACGPTTTAGPASPDGNATDTPTEAAEPSPTGDLVTSLALGAWRPHPVEASAELLAPLEAACRSADATAAALPLAAAEVRGERLVTLVFGGPEGPGSACRLDLEAPASPLGVLELPAAAGPADGIELSFLGRIDDPGGTRTVAIGRVGPISAPPATMGGPTPATVVGQLDTEQYIWATFERGWFAMWWPGIAQSGPIAVLNGRNEVIDNVPATAD